jgi:tetratricopeptide (TPR) repeat protein
MASPEIPVLKHVEELIQQGEFRLAREALLRFRRRNLEARERVYYCSLLRRSGLSLEAIKVLHPWVYPKSRSTYLATAEERLEYASCLVRLEVLSEAERILLSLDHEQHPVAWLRLGLLHTVRWDYETANRCFERYIEHSRAEPYDRLIAQVNLLQGYTYLEKVNDAKRLADELFTALDPTQHKLLLAAVFELRAEVARLEEKFDAAFGFIQKGHTLLDDVQTIDGFLIRKQKAVIEAYFMRSTKPLEQVRKEARERKAYESLRDLDFHTAILSRNSLLLNAVYWRTQSPSYKQRVFLAAERGGLKLNTESFRQGPANKGACFDLQAQALTGTHAHLKPNSALARLFKALVSEGYKPAKLFDLFAAVYGDEIFFPESSPDKMHQLIKRLREFLIEARLPAEITCQGSQYRMVLGGKLNLSQTNHFVPAWEEALRTKTQTREFTAALAQKVWDCSLRTTLRRIEDLKTRGRVQFIGNTRSRRFHFV